MSAILRAVRQGAASRARNMGTAHPDIVKQQQFYQRGHGHGADNPTYMKGPMDKAVNIAAVSITAVGFCLSMRGFYNMSLGINKS